MLTHFLGAVDLPALLAAAEAGGILTRLLLRAVNVGAEWVLWILFLLSFLSIGLIVERVFYLWKHRVDAGELREMLVKFLSVGDVRSAYNEVATSEAIECKVLAAGLAAAGRGPQACSEAMLSTKARERVHMDAGLSILATIGSNAPFIGLLGTVLGIINAAQQLTSNASQAGQSAALGGVFEALVATAVGLFVAIPAVVAYNLLQRQVRARMAQVDSLAHFLLSVVPPQHPPARV